MSVIVSDRRTLVVGLGKTGLSCVRYLSEQGRDVAVADSRQAPPGLDQLKADWPDIPVHLGTFDTELFAGFNELVVSPHQHCRIASRRAPGCKNLQRH